MESYDRIIESLSVHFRESYVIQIEEAFGIEHSHYEIENMLVYVEKGDLYFGQDKELVKEGEALFIPEGKGVPISFLEPKPARILGSDYHTQYKAFSRQQNSDLSNYKGIFICVQFSAKVFDAVNLFSSLDIPPFVVRDESKIQRLMQEINDETTDKQLGSENMLACKSQELVIRIFRYIISRQLFVQQIITNSNNLRDDRLMQLFSHINENLSEDLSNKNLAEVVHVSQDYVGQYFKTLTGINPQDYIEFQRMQAAIMLLRGTNKNIEQVGRSVGYKDSSYFCRRFKMMFGISAGKMRRRARVKPTEA